MTNQVDQIINDAEQAAATQTQGNTALAQNQSNIPTTVTPAPSPITMETAAAANMMADDWLKFSFYGMSVAESPSALFDECRVEINMTEGAGFKICEMIRYGSKPVNYAHTYDRVTDDNGSPWRTTLETAASIDPTARPYPAVQLPMTLLEDITGMDRKKETVVAQAGAVLGYTTSPTGWPQWAALYNDVKAAGKLGQTVQVVITNQPRDKNDNQWGIPKFTLVTD